MSKTVTASGISILTGSSQFTLTLPYDCSEVEDFPTQRTMETIPKYFTCNLIQRSVQEALCEDFAARTNAEDENDTERDLSNAARFFYWDVNYKGKPEENAMIRAFMIFSGALLCNS